MLQPGTLGVIKPTEYGADEHVPLASTADCAGANRGPNIVVKGSMLHNQLIEVISHIEGSDVCIVYILSLNAYRQMNIDRFNVI